ncbi:MAG: hypothetical protein Kow0089_06960 [Desulfobulbaceae bacterium]
MTVDIRSCSGYSEPIPVYIVFRQTRVPMPGRKPADTPSPVHQGPDHAAPYPVSRLAPPIRLVDLAREIDEADRMIGARVNAELRVIVDQIRKLREQAEAVLEKARQDQDLHRVRCTFKRVVGKTYHLYEKEDGSRYFSLLSPDDWRGSPPDRYVAPYRLEPDLSWTPADDERRR